MSIDVVAFTPLASTVGGVLIGVGAALLLLSSGRIAGISGIAGGVINGTSADRQWRLAFLIGLVVAPLLYAFFTTSSIFEAGMIERAHINIEDRFVRVALSGLLVGIGTGLAGGCTSGHGVCGIARFSPRSLLATALFMSTAIIVVFVSRHVLGTH